MAKAKRSTVQVHPLLWQKIDKIAKAKSEKENYRVTTSAMVNMLLHRGLLVAEPALRAQGIDV